MCLIHYIDDVEDRSFFHNSCCAIGVFDGIHKGHQYLLGQVRSQAKTEGTRSVAITFSIDPDEILREEPLKKLMENDVRLSKLARSGIDAVAVLPFNKEFAMMEPNPFLDWIFQDQLPCSIHVGTNFRFGRKAVGDIDLLKNWGEMHNVGIFDHELLTYDGIPISSTRIRKLIADNRDIEAALLL